jgi:hypothetical protein
MTCGDLATKLTAGTGGDAGQAPRHRNQSWPSGSRHAAHLAPADYPPRWTRSGVLPKSLKRHVRAGVPRQN